MDTTKNNAPRVPDDVGAANTGAYHARLATISRAAVRASGYSERVAMRLTGHKTRRVFDRYDIVSEGDLRDAALKLDAAAVTENPKDRAVK